MAYPNYDEFQPMRVQVKAGSGAAKLYYRYAGLPGNSLPLPKAIARGIEPSPARDLLFHGGKTVPRMQFQNIFVGGAPSWKQSDVSSIDQAITLAMSDPQLDNVMVQYFPNQKLSCEAIPFSIVDGEKPSSVSQGDIENRLKSLYDNKTLKGVDLDSTIFNFILPSGTVLTDSSAPTSSAEKAEAKSKASRGRERVASSLNGLGGYHGSIHLSSRITLYYSVNVFSEIKANGSENGIVAFDHPWKNVVATLYHEMNEFRTDPDVEDTIRTGKSDFLGWTSRQGEEVGDYPIMAADNNLSLVFQEVQAAKKKIFLPIHFQYSNFVHGPEGPIRKAHQ